MLTGRAKIVIGVLAAAAVGFGAGWVANDAADGGDPAPTASPVGGGPTRTARPAATPTPEPTATIEPTAYQRRLTAMEAAALVQVELNDEASQRYSDEVDREDADPVLIQYRGCEAGEFNESIRAWIITCEQSLSDPVNNIDLGMNQVTVRLFDESEEIEFVQ
jgi:hypothetical protein